MNNLLLSNQQLNNSNVIEESANKIISLFEKILRDNNIVIPDIRRIGDEDESCIYGETYENLEKDISGLLSNNLK